MSVKVPTRAEYYTAQGFSGSAIDRPDDPIDDEFIRHCNGLKAFANGFIDYCKTGEQQMPYSGLIENSNVEVFADENMQTVIKTTDNIMQAVRELLKLYTRLHYLYEEKSTSTEKVLTSQEFAQQSLAIIDNHTEALRSLINKQRLLEEQLQSIKLELKRAKHEHDYVGAINKLIELLDLKV